MEKRQEQTQIFHMTDLEGMREFTRRAYARSPSIRRARLALYDRLRYREDYVGCARIAETLGAHIVEFEQTD